ncbi:unnamed protein product, partial [Laminaria digitata]
EIANACGERALGSLRAERALTMRGVDRPMVKARAAGVLLTPDTIERGRLMLREAAESASDPFEVYTIARGMVFAGGGLNVPEMLEEGILIIEELADEHRELPIIMYDLSVLLYQIGRRDEGVARLIQAAELDERNVLLAQRAADLNQAMGNMEASARWQEEADRRATP